MKIEAQNIGKQFAYRSILKDISFEVQSGTALGITGPNGSGKTTLIRILCGLIMPTKGKVIFYDNETRPLARENIFQYIGLVGPYLELYEDLTAEENISFFAGMKDINFRDGWIDTLFDRFGLSRYRKQVVRGYSSGMRQRLKYIFALMAKPEILFLDEPTSNLDNSGSQEVYAIMEEQKKQRILIFATNSVNEINFGDQQIDFYL